MQFTIIVVLYYHYENKRVPMSVSTKAVKRGFFIDKKVFYTNPPIRGKNKSSCVTVEKSK